MTDLSAHLQQEVRARRASGNPVYLQGGGSKALLFGRACAADPLSVADHCGIVDYQPDELVITARAGTPVRELTGILRAQRQMLSCETPDFAGLATLGGSLACNLSGAGRPWRGALRDLVLGIRFINGEGELLRYGGQVMKNVAGYDVSRLHAGALGTLGLITEVSLKVMPAPEHSLTLTQETDVHTAQRRMLELARRAGPLSGACWLDGHLHIRLCGSDRAVHSYAAELGGEVLAGNDAPWDSLAHFTFAAASPAAALWRLSVPPASPLTLPEVAAIPCPQVLDWGGAQRLYAGDYPDLEMHTLAARMGGHAVRLRGGSARGEVCGPVSAAEQALQKRLKNALDPAGIFNPGRLYSWL